jgi:DNA (cytosine-5)-methyltransferase 1
MLNGLGFCSGIGRLEYALEPWVRWIACCEREPYPAGILVGLGAWVWDDLTTFPWTDFKGRIDIVAGGFPCQDVSPAGLQKGMDGERSILVFEIIKGCVQVGADILFLENVPRASTIMGTAICQALAQAGYDARWCCIRVPLASPVGEGERWFLLAKARSQGLEGVHHARGGEYLQPTQAALSTHKWEAEPEVDRVVTRMPWRTDRIKALGNAVVSEQARQAFQILSGAALPSADGKDVKP